jgi:hypothetical protein
MIAVTTCWRPGGQPRYSGIAGRWYVTVTGAVKPCRQVLPDSPLVSQPSTEKAYVPGSGARSVKNPSVRERRR